MDEIEKKLYHDLQSNVDIPEKCEEIIKEGLNKKKRQYSLAKIIITTCASLIMTIGMVYAGTTVIEKIWKQPQKIVGGRENSTITKEEMNGIMDENEARQKAEEILKKFGYEKDIIKLVELKKNVRNDKLDWYIETENEKSIYFDAEDGKELSLFSNNRLNKNIKEYHTTKAKAEKTARELCEKYGYDLSEYNYVKIESNMESEDKAYIWYIDFYKETNNLVNEYSRISIAFIPEINELYYFVVRDENYENNSIIITEQQAKEAALKEEQKISTKYKIKNTQAKLSIVSTNGDAYARVTDYKQFCEERNILDYPKEKWIEYRTEGRIRTAWKVMIEYDVPINDMFTETFNITDLGYTYYIDATTGEVIGGEAYDKPIMTRFEGNELVIDNDTN